MISQDQIEEHVDERVMIQVHTYYGQTRTLDSKMLAEQDIVLTTYQTLAADEKVRDYCTWDHRLTFNYLFNCVIRC